MSEDIYAKPDLTKKVRFKAGEKDDRNMDVCDDIDSVRIYDNCWAEESTPRDKSEDKSEDQQQMSSVTVSSGKRNHFGAAAVFLGLLCLLLLVAVIVLVVLLIPERNQMLADNVRLIRARDELQTSYSKMRNLNHNLTNERKELQTNYSKMEIHNANLTQKMSQLESQKDDLNATVNKLNKTIDELRKHIETTCCPEDWIKFGRSCYLMSKTEKNWHDSKSDCETRGAHLVIISSEEEQEFISSFNRRVWIGLTDEEGENKWKWVDGTSPARMYWSRDPIRQPDNHNRNEDCVEISPDRSTENWNDLQCSKKLNFICEIMLK